MFPVYPRRRGEHEPEMNTLEGDFGLSPLARGTRLSKTIVNLNMRFIPAGAGNTCTTPHRTITETVYPRWRGEHF